MAKSVFPKPVRHFVVFVHVIVSVGWMGAGLANIILASVALASSDADVTRVSYGLMWSLEEFLIIPGAFAALGTGVLLSLTTPWGLSQYWWVLTKLVLTVGIILFSTFFIGVWVELSIEVTEGGAAVSPYRELVAYWPWLSVVAFFLMTWLSVAKPWGKTPWAKKKAPKRAQRRTPAHAAAGGVALRADSSPAV